MTKNSIPKIYCTINGRKYKCLFTQGTTTFYDVADKKMFFTVDNFTNVSALKNHQFFNRA